MKIIVTGASGKLGQLVVRNLLAKIDPDEIGVSVRDVTKANEFMNRGVRVRYGDFEDSNSLIKAFEGGNSILIVSPNVMGDAAIRQHQTAIECAKLAGAQNIFYTSHMGASLSSEFSPMISHAKAEQFLVEQNVSYTSLRNGFYAETGAMMLGDAINSGNLSLPADGPVAWTSHEDLAEVASLILIQGGSKGITQNLTAREALDFKQIAEMVSDIAGREIRRVVVRDDKHESLLKSRGVPQDRINIIMGMFRASRNGEFVKTDPALAQLLRREPMSMHEVLNAKFADYNSSRVE